VAQADTSSTSETQSARRTALLEPSGEILNKVFKVLEAHRESDEALANARLLASGL